MLNEAPQGTEALERYLKDVETTILRTIQNTVISEEENEDSKEVKKFLYELEASSKVMIPMDKTNSYVLMELYEYKDLMNKKLRVLYYSHYLETCSL